MVIVLYWVVIVLEVAWVTGWSGVEGTVTLRKGPAPLRMPYADQRVELDRIQAAEGGSRDGEGGDPPAAVRLGESRPCAVCGVPTAEACGGCGTVPYCPEHRVEDWPYHQRVCDRWGRHAEDVAWEEGGGARASASAAVRALAAAMAADGARVGEIVAGGWETVRDLVGGPGECGGQDDAEWRAVAAVLSRPLTIIWALARAPGVLAGIDGPDFVLDVAAATEREVETAGAFRVLAAAIPPLLGRPARLSVRLVGLALRTEHLTRCAEMAVAVAPALTLSCIPGAYHPVQGGGAGVPDLVAAFDAGFLMYREWGRTLGALLPGDPTTPAPPVLVTSYRGFEQRAEVRLLSKLVPARSSLPGFYAVPPQPNPFASPQWEPSVTIFNDGAFDNSYVLMWRGT